MKTILHSRLAWFAAFAVAIMAATVLLAAVLTEETTVEDIFDRGLYEFYLSLRVDSEANIVADYEWSQVMFMPLLLPDATHTLTQNGGLLPVTDWAGFSKEFVAGLVPVDRDGITYWPVRVMEYPGTTPRRRLIINARAEIIAEMPAPKDYDPAWWVKERYPQLYDGTTTAEDEEHRKRLEALFDGVRLVMQCDLIDGENLVKLVLQQSVAAILRAQEEEEGGGMMMMGWGGGSVTNIQFVEIALADTNGTLNVTLAYPDDFTNRISLIACTNLLDPDWSLLLTTNPPTSTNAFTYVDTDATNHTARFYHAYNADYDSDGDGLSDGAERFLFDTDPNDPNDPPNVKGTISYVSYSGGQTGLIRVVAVTSSNDWSADFSNVISDPGAYHIVNIPPGNYWLKAFRDSDGDGTAGAYEAQGFYTNHSVAITGQLTAAHIALGDPDTDSDGLPDWWELWRFGNLAETGTGDPDADGLSNLTEYLAGTDPNVEDVGYIPNDKYGQNWPTNIPISPPAVGAPTQEREYKLSFAGIESTRPNDGVARALMTRVDAVLVDAIANRSNWTAYAALELFPTGGEVHGITNPAVNANFEREYHENHAPSALRWPTHTAFMDVYFDTTNDLNYVHDVAYRLRQRFDNTERWHNHMAGGATVSTRVEFMSKVDRMTDPANPGFSEVTENRNVARIPALPATNIQSRIDDFQDGRWPEDLVDWFTGNPHPEARKVGNPAWTIREYLMDVEPSVSATDLLKFRPRLVLMSERRRQHLRLNGLKLSFVPGMALDNVYIVSLDAAHVYEEAPLLAYMRGETNSLPPALGSFVELEVEFERDTSHGLDDLILAETNQVTLANLLALRDAFLEDQQTIVELITAEFNEKPADMTAIYSVKAALLDLSSHGRIAGSGVTRHEVAGIVGGGLAFDGNGYVQIVADANVTPNTVTVDPNSPFILAEFQTRGNRDAIEDEDGDNDDWIEIRNVSGTAQSLNGWYLKDSQNQWQFPAVTLGAGEQLTVFASGKNRTNPIAPLHANFSISGGGEYLALVWPNGTSIATEYATPTILPFDFDVSYGIVTAGTGYVEGYFNANPGEPNGGIYRPAPMEVGIADFTISLWLRTTNAGVALLSKSDTNGVFDAGEKQIYLDANGIVRYAGQGAGSIVGSTAVHDGAWHHVAVTFAAGGGGIARIYVDGTDDTDGMATDFTATPDPTGANVYLGYATSTNAASHLSGTLDEVAIWGRELSANEIGALHASGVQGLPLDTRANLASGLLYHASMDVFLVPNDDTKYRQAFDLLEEASLP